MLNSLVLCGNLTNAVKHETDDNNVSTSKFSIAVVQHGKYRDKPIFMNCTAKGAVADLIKNNCGKGDKVTVSGQLMYVDNKPNSYHWMMVRDFEPALWPNQREKAESKGMTTQANDDMPY